MIINRMHQKLPFFLLTMLLAIGGNVQALPFFNNEVSWSEQTLLHDQTKITIKRSVERGGDGVADKSSITHERIEFSNPVTREIVTWHDKVNKQIGGSNFNPLMVDIYKGTVYLVASPKGCLSYNYWGRPNPQYVIFSYAKKKWHQLELKDLPLELKFPNVAMTSNNREGTSLHSQALLTAFLQSNEWQQRVIN